MNGVPVGGRYSSALARTAATVAVVPETNPPYQAATAMAGSSTMKTLRPWRIGSRGMRSMTAAAMAAIPNATRDRTRATGDDRSRADRRAGTECLVAT